jgi:xylan 1,4-beta-xylosidase
MKKAPFLLVLGVWTIVAPAQQQVKIDANGAVSPFPHFWEEMFGSGRAILTLRESYRNDLEAVKAVTDFRYVRFHAIFHDEVGVYNEDEHGNPVYNFAYVDQIYDGLLKRGVRPFVEISFMPKKLAFNPDALHPFWYKQNVSPPKSMERWDDLIKQFARHLVERYGTEELAQWYFEVWNEPNIDFWNGIPRQKSYFDLYDHTARTLKSVSPRLRVGGPATAGCMGRRFPKARGGESRARGFCFEPRLRRRYGGGPFRNQRGHSDGRSRVPCGGESSKADSSIGNAEVAAVLDRVECSGHE